MFLVLETKRISTSAYSRKQIVFSYHKEEHDPRLFFCINMSLPVLCWKSEGWAGGWSDLGTTFIFIILLTYNLSELFLDRILMLF